jgi:hypothetical protein
VILLAARLGFGPDEREPMLWIARDARRTNSVRRKPASRRRRLAGPPEPPSFTFGGWNGLFGPANLQVGGLSTGIGRPMIPSGHLLRCASTAIGSACPPGRTIWWNAGELRAARRPGPGRSQSGFAGGVFCLAAALHVAAPTVSCVGCCIAVADPTSVVAELSLRRGRSTIAGTDVASNLVCGGRRGGLFGCVEDSAGQERDRACGARWRTTCAPSALG